MSSVSINPIEQCQFLSNFIFQQHLTLLTLTLEVLSFVYLIYFFFLGFLSSDFAVPFWSPLSYLSFLPDLKCQSPSGFFHPNFVFVVFVVSFFFSLVFFFLLEMLSSHTQLLKRRNWDSCSHPWWFVFLSWPSKSQESTSKLLSGLSIFLQLCCQPGCSDSPTTVPPGPTAGVFEVVSCIQLIPSLNYSLISASIFF